MSNKLIKSSLNKEMSSKKYSDNKNTILLISFILPIIAMLVVYYFKDIVPMAFSGGDQMYLRSDCYHQYAPYLQILQDKLRNGGSLLYTWEIGGGMNFTAIAAYYLASPLNMLTLLWPFEISDIVSFFIILKMGLSGFSMSYYLTKRFNKTSYINIAFGFAYAMSAYFAAFNWNIMWLDCMWLLPFIVLGIDRLARERKGKMYCIALGLAVLSNYYIGIMLCIFSFMYFIYTLICTDSFEIVKSKAITRLIFFRDYVVYSLLAGCFAACFILPEFFALLTTKSADTTFPESIEAYFSVLYMLFRSLINIPVADLKYPHDPNIYCSVAVFILIPLFMFCKKIKLSERIGKVALAGFFLISFNTNVLNYIWHGFHFPNSLPCRQSFIYIFLILVMAYEAIIHIRHIKLKHVGISLIGSIGLVLLFQELFKSVEFFSDNDIGASMVKIVYYSILFMLIYGCIILAYKKYPSLKPLITYVLILTVFCEMTLNMITTGIPSTSSRNGYYEDVEAFEKAEALAKTDADKEKVAFYRAETKTHSTRNDGARFKYNSISTFSSVASADMQTYFSKVGLQTSFNAYDYYGHTPLTSSLFSIRYEYSTDGAASIPSSSSVLDTVKYTTASNAEKSITIYENKNTLPLGFMINQSLMTNWDMESGNPFLTQNNFIACTANTGAIFHRLRVDSPESITLKYELDSNDIYTPSNDSNYDVYFFCSTSSDSITATVTTASGSSTTTTFPSTNQNYICHLGNVLAGSTIKLSASDGNSIGTTYAYAFDSAAWDRAYAVLNANPYQVQSFSETNIVGTVNATNDGLMYTSIPYDEG